MTRERIHYSHESSCELAVAHVSLTAEFCAVKPVYSPGKSAEVDIHKCWCVDGPPAAFAVAMVSQGGKQRWTEVVPLKTIEEFHDIDEQVISLLSSPTWPTSTCRPPSVLLYSLIKNIMQRWLVQTA